MSHSDASSETTAEHLARLVERTTEQLALAYPTVDPARVREVVEHAAIELGGAADPSLGRRIRRRAEARLDATAGEWTVIRRAPRPDVGRAS